MLERTKNYIYDRRRGLLTTVGGLGVGYVTGQYIVSRLEEVRDRIMKEKSDKDNLVRRFQQNVQDSTFTTMAHLPTLATQVMSDMDVESLISRLQQARAPRQPLSQPLAPPQLSDPPPSNVSTSARDSEPPSSNVAKSWVEQFSASSENSLSLSAGDIATASAEQTLSLPTHSAPPTSTDTDTQSETGAGATTEFHSLPTDNGDADLERSSEGLEGARDELESIIDADVNVDPNVVQEQGSASERMDAKSDSLMSVPETSSQASGSSADKDSAVMVNLDYTNPTPSAETFAAPPPLSNKEKLALWKELTTLTFTRALTSLYALAFLTLLTHTQLSLLARYRYLAAIREARRAETREQRSTLGGLFFGNHASEDDDLLSVHPDSEIGDEMDLNEEGGYWDEEGRWWDASGRGGLFGRDGVGSLTERKFLTLGWWFLNRGWKNIGERVREAVSEVFTGMSLKSQISPKQLEDLILQVRARVEGDPKTFLLHFDPLATLLPNTPTDISTTLASGGLTSSLAHVDPALSTLLTASHTHISSADFAIALRKCLDFGTIAMKEGLIRSGEFGEATNTSADSESTKVKLAALLPGVARWTHLALNGVPNEIIEGFAELREVTGYSAIVLSSFEGILGSYA
ncbi:peroxin-3 [Rhizoctonia solani]|uniref:Peroxin-3 n=1 Tax=Rhizoctonia solani TaxID=456999 RepID=A0A0K6G332_9AGAM|nr:peroxin-3 [Rhizoctonia solani]